MTLCRRVICKFSNPLMVDSIVSYMYNISRCYRLFFFVGYMYAVIVVFSLLRVNVTIIVVRLLILATVTIGLRRLTVVVLITEVYFTSIMET